MQGFLQNFFPAASFFLFLHLEPLLAAKNKPSIRDFVSNYEPQANKKFFGAAVFQKCCRGVGEQPTFAEQI